MMMIYMYIYIYIYIKFSVGVKDSECGLFCDEREACK